MFGMTREMVNEVKKEYPPGVTVQLVYTRDIKHPIAIGSEGKVIKVDDIGTIHVKWEDGQKIGIIYGEDTIRIVQR